MLKAIMLRIAAFILIVAGWLVLLFGCEYASSSLVGVFELLGCVAALIACSLLAIYCCWTADDIEDSPALGETLGQPIQGGGNPIPNPPTYQKGNPKNEAT